MREFKETLTLSTTDLKARRGQLERELSIVIEEIVTTEIKEEISKAISEEIVDDKPNIVRLVWDFYPESDDEGGSDWWVTDVVAYDSEGNYVDMEEYTCEQPSWDGKSTYQVSLDEVIREILSENRDDLYDQDITEIEL
jgi:hypothetical protein